jgi:hypothetical protein
VVFDAREQAMLPLEVLHSPYRSLIRPILAYVNEADERYDDDVLTVILPEFIPSKWWQHLLHNQTALAIRPAALACTLILMKKIGIKKAYPSNAVPA